jgi:hypothetical protein
MLGNNFLRGWYSIFDFEQRKVGLALSLGSLAKFDKGVSIAAWTIVLIVLAGLIVIGLIIFAIIKYRKYKNAK